MKTKGAQAQEVTKAAAQLEPKSGSKVAGTFTFTKVGDEVQVVADIQNLTPGNLLQVTQINESKP